MKLLLLPLFIFFCVFAQASEETVLVGCGTPGAVERFVRCFGVDAQKKFKVALVAINDHNAIGGNVLDVLFDYYGDLTVVKARELIVNLTNALLASAENETKLASYFCNYPLTVADVTILIRHRKSTCGFVYPTLENIDSILLQDGRIYYRTINGNTYAINVLRTESFDDALNVMSYTAPIVPSVFQ